MSMVEAVEKSMTQRRRDAEAGWGIVRGFVRDEAGAPVEGAVIGMAMRVARTDAAGYFALLPVEVGSHAGFVEAAGFDGARVQDVQVRTAKATEIEIALRKADPAQCPGCGLNVIETGWSEISTRTRSWMGMGRGGRVMLEDHLADAHQVVCYRCKTELRAGAAELLRRM